MTEKRTDVRIPNDEAAVATWKRRPAAGSGPNTIENYSWCKPNSSATCNSSTGSGA